MQEPTSGTVRRLVLMRHAKAEPTAPSDHGRVLAPRGRADAGAAGRWLREQGIVPDAALVSDALRTQETWSEVAAAAAWDVDAEFSAALYAAGADTTFDLLRETDPGASTLVVIGHNPAMAYLAELIDDGEGAAEATTSLITRGLPTSALVVFALEVGWAEVGPGTGRLQAFHVGHG